MKTLGLLGGMSWESTVTYYQLLNRMTRERLGGLHSARLLLWSFDFAEIEAHQASGDWAAATAMMVDAAKRLEDGGAEGLVICTNTMHKMADDVQAALSIPLIHIAEATGAALSEAGCKRPLLLATRYTMEQAFYRGRLETHFDLQPMVPDQAGRDLVHTIIYEELCRGIVSDASRQAYLGVVAEAEQQGADSVIFGCTEVGLLLSQHHLNLRAFDTTVLHAQAALDFALS
ncbi:MULTISPECIES: aspartate/glutamate racemase family protein [Pseudovibrio]|uniref:aspartate/glutamate racemase family protein n=1 Tax=Stappiaceae TaxID=2821832 RepID=UPI00236698A5|nr:MULTISPECIES: aspartate/glutamate racemase family protein [Pseudovibrio]MDD7909882.1 aspartate/glutamate racemase family protein [Pseudovibrio exalbescens]MDX5592220.1 aspartate/glutamate racemase family protein [Pseudovibrio sp. SPO723]